MKIGILSRNPSLYSTRRLAQASWSRGHQVRVVDTTAVAVHVGGHNAASGPGHILSPGSLGLPRAQQMPELDAIIPRIGASVTFYGLAVVRQFEAGGVLTTASSDAIAVSRDKLHSLQLMTRAGLATPRSAIIAQPEALYAAVHAVGGLPVVVKQIQGTQGRGVVLAHQLGDIAALVRQARARNRQILLQEYIAEAAGRDLRVIVVNGQCVAAMERRAGHGEFRANLHRGGTAVPVELDAATCRLAKRAAEVHGLSVAGVDLLQSSRGPLVLEVNSSPGLEGIERATGQDVAAAIISFVERSVSQRGRTKPQK